MNEPFNLALGLAQVPFSTEQLNCPCGCHGGCATSELKIVLAAFKHWLKLHCKRDIWLELNSVYRCEAHNATLPGASPNSQHTKGLAVDLWSPDLDAKDLYLLAQECGLWTTVLYYPNKHFIHCDIRDRGGHFVFQELT